MQAFEPQFITVVMPALNEEGYIADAIASLLVGMQTLDYELLVLDGGSIDRTCEVVENLAKSNQHLKLVHNPRRTQSAAMNIGAEVCDPRSTVLVRADCHAIYPPRFVENCANSLVTNDCASVVVSMNAIGRTPLQRAIAAAQNSRIGNGGSRHRRVSASGYVDHGHHAAFDRKVFRSLGGYDESAPFNEDAEFDARLIRAGGRIYLDGPLTINYYPRTSFSSLVRQYYRHGWGRANTLLKQSMRPKVRQVLPVIALMTVVFGLVAWPLIGPAAILPAAAYLGLCIGWGMLLAVRTRQLELALSGPAAIAMHMSWAAGFLTRVSGARAPATR